MAPTRISSRAARRLGWTPAHKVDSLSPHTLGAIDEITRVDARVCVRAHKIRHPVCGPRPFLTRPVSLPRAALHAPHSPAPTAPRCRVGGTCQVRVRAQPVAGAAAHRGARGGAPARLPGASGGAARAGGVHAGGVRARRRLGAGSTGRELPPTPGATPARGSAVNRLSCVSCMSTTCTWHPVHTSRVSARPGPYDMCYKAVSRLSVIANWPRMSVASSIFGVRGGGFAGGFRVS